jgi:hypothetical protein
MMSLAKRTRREGGYPITETPSYGFDVFISYSRADSDWVWQELLPRLDAAGLRVCIDDRNFEYGVPTLINIERAVDRSRFTLVVLSPTWIESEWTEFESLLVGTTDPNGRRRRIIPLMLHPCQGPTRLVMLTHADFTDPVNRVAAFGRLVGQLLQQQLVAPMPSDPPSPFVAGPPITHPSGFFGREREAKRMLSLWKRRPLQNSALIGPRRSGKTSLLQYLRYVQTAPLESLRPGQRANRLPDSDRYRWIFVDFQDARLSTRDGLLRYILAELSLPVPAPCDLPTFLDIVTRQLRSPTVILFDEIGAALQRYPELDDTFWEAMRSVSSNSPAGNIGFAIASSDPPDMLAQHTGHSSPFFNIFAYTANLGPLSEREALDLIGSSPVEFPAADVDWILAQSGRWPILLQILCRERLYALEEADISDTWRRDAVRQLTPFEYLLHDRRDADGTHVGI